MFTIDRLTGITSLNRGDTALFTLFINSGSDLLPIEYELNEKDTIYIAIEEPNQPFEHAIVKKVVNNANTIKDNNGNFIIELTPTDTQCLMSGLYYYEIKLRQYRENQFRNMYQVITFNSDNTYVIIDEEQLDECQNYKVISTGTYSINEDTYTLIDLQGQEFSAKLYDNILILDNLKYKREENIVTTIIPQTKFIIER